MNRIDEFNLEGRFVHIGDGKCVPVQSIRSIEILTDTDKVKIARRYPNSRKKFQFRIRFTNGSQKLAVTLYSETDAFALIEPNVLTPMSHLLKFRPLTNADLIRLKKAYPLSYRNFRTRIELFNGDSIPSTWSAVQFTGMPEDKLLYAPKVQPRQNGNRGQEQQAIAGGTLSLTVSSNPWDRNPWTDGVSTGNPWSPLPNDPPANTRKSRWLPTSWFSR